MQHDEMTEALNNAPSTFYVSRREGYYSPFDAASAAEALEACATDCGYESYADAQEDGARWEVIDADEYHDLLFPNIDY